jgi:hypothetical protein
VNICSLRKMMEGKGLFEAKPYLSLQGNVTKKFAEVPQS